MKVSNRRGVYANGAFHARSLFVITLASGVNRIAKIFARKAPTITPVIAGDANLSMESLRESASLKRKWRSIVFKRIKLH